MKELTDTDDADKAREKLPRGSSAEKAGENVGKEAGAAVDEAVRLPFFLTFYSLSLF